MMDLAFAAKLVSLTKETAPTFLPYPTADSIMREIMNGCWFILSLALTVTFAFRVYVRITENPASWRNNEGVGAAIALFVFFLGSSARSLWIWLLLNCQNDEKDCAWIQSSYEFLVVATALAIIGATCCVRVFSPPRWRPWGWISVAVVALVIPMIVYLI